MSDVPAAALWTTSLVMALRPPSRASAALSGIAAGIAILIRPNLAPSVVFPAGVVAWRASAPAGVRVKRLIPFAIACLPFVVLARELPPATVVISGLHSGSIRLYSQLTTLRVDLLDRAWLDRAIDHLKSVGPPPHLVLEESEVREFRQRFANQRAVALVDRPAVAVHSRHVYVFSSGLQRLSDPPQTIPHTQGCE